MKDNIYIVCIFILTIAVCYGIKYIITYQKEIKTKKFVLWVTSDDTHSRGNNRQFPLHIYLNTARLECNLSDKYAIMTETEKKYEAIILDEFKKHITKNHLNNNLSLIKSKHIVPNEIHFFYFLSAFLFNHETKYEFSGQKMFSELISEKKYESGGEDRTYSLSEFGVVYYKTQYLAINGYLKSDIVQPNDFLLKKHKEYLEEVLLTNTVELSYL